MPRPNGPSSHCDGFGVGGRARLGAGAAVTGLRPPELVADGAGVGLQRRADQRRVVVYRGTGQRAVVGEDQVVAVVAALVGQVVAGVGRDAREAPRVLAHQLGVGVDGKLGGPRRPGW